MNPFEAFQKLKPEIEQDEAFMTTLRLYAFTDRLRLPKDIVSLGGGEHNIHFRIGQVGGMWLATREYQSIVLDIEDRMQHCENYIAKAVRASERGKRVPLVCGAVRADRRYFLLLEDLTHGGEADFVPARRSGGISGTIDGIEVFHDFDTERPLHPPTKYLAEDKLLILES